MINQSNISDWIERYLDLDLSAEQELMFHRSLEENPGWQDELEQEKVLRKAIAVYNVNRIKKQVRADLDSGKAYQVHDIPWKYILTIVGVLAVISYLGYSVVSLEYQKENDQSGKGKVLQKEKTEEIISDTLKHSASDITEKKDIESKETKSHKEDITNNSVRSFLAQMTEAVDTSAMLKVADSVSGSLVVKSEKAMSDTAVTVGKPVANNENKSNSKPLPVEDCSIVTISFSLSTEGTCPGNEEGVIKVLDIKGGKGPYSKVLLNEYEEEVPFTFLSSGKYKVVLSDKNGCMESQEVLVPEKNCDKPLELLFRPSLETSIKIPVSRESGRIEIIDQGNSIIWSDNFRFGNQFVEWNGNDRYGKKASNGVYAIMIHYDDGKLKNGFITVY